MRAKTLITQALYRSPLPTDVAEKLLFLAVHGYWPNIKAPRSFAEKIVHRKIHSHGDSRLVQLSDKFAVRDFVAKRIGKQHLIPLKYVGKTLDPKMLHSLGDNLVVKLNNDCGSAQFIDNNTYQRACEVCTKIDKSMTRDFGKNSNQWWYSAIEPKIMVEEKLQDWDDKIPTEYQLFIFPKSDKSATNLLFSIVQGRGSSEHELNYFDLDMNEFTYKGQPISSNYKNGGFPFPDPDLGEEMKDIAEKLARGFDHVRVDLYVAKKQVYFGELTFSSGGGRLKWNPQEFDDYLGQLWDWDQPYF